jgi:hypothetical protein
MLHREQRSANVMVVVPINKAEERRQSLFFAFKTCSPRAEHKCKQQLNYYPMICKRPRANKNITACHRFVNTSPLHACSPCYSPHCAIGMRAVNLFLGTVREHPACLFLSVAPPNSKCLSAAIKRIYGQQLLLI